MHDAAFNFVERTVAMLGRYGRNRVVELGSRNVNGSVRPLFSFAKEYCGVDIAEGPGVDVVADAAVWQPNCNLFDIVVSTEALEHTPHPDMVCVNAYKLLRSGGIFIVTAAAPPRRPHSGHDGGSLRQGEYYANVHEGDLRSWLNNFSTVFIDTFSNVGDIYAIAVK